MDIRGYLHNGVVVLERDPGLPEGTEVTVQCPAFRNEQGIAAKKKRLQLPLVHTGQPGTIDLTNEWIAEILDEEDASP